MKSRESQLACRKGLAASLLITLIFVVVNFYPVLRLGLFSNPRTAILVGIGIAFPSLIMFMILYTGKVSKWRKVFFTTFAVAFVISTVWMHIGDRGHMWILDEELLYSKLPTCHLVMPMLLLPVIFNSEIIYPADLVSGLGMLLMIIIVGLVYGRAFCAWGCFFGGQDELFSSLRKKKSWNIKKPHPFIRYFAFALLVFIVIHSFVTLVPTYCVWLCPFKTTSEFPEVNSAIRIIQTFIFVSLWLSLVVVLPIATKKRIQCGLFCPLGACLSLTNKINLFEIKIGKDKCNRCNLCISICPTFSMTEESLAKGKPWITCTKCGTCIEACPSGAISYSAKGVSFTSGDHPLLVGRTNIGFFRKLASDIWDPGVVFVFGIFWLGTNLAAPYLVDAMSRLLLFFLGA